jgi:hypothetical protein
MTTLRRKAWGDHRTLQSGCRSPQLCAARLEATTARYREAIGNHSTAQLGRHITVQGGYRTQKNFAERLKIQRIVLRGQRSPQHRA